MVMIWYGMAIYHNDYIRNCGIMSRLWEMNRESKLTLLPE